MTEAAPNKKCDCQESRSNHSKEDGVAAGVSEDISSVHLSSTTEEQASNILICDAGYGLPREKRPRKEKILAIASQLVNFLEWQLSSQSRTAKSSIDAEKNLAQVRVVGCYDQETKSALESRTRELLGRVATGYTSLPPHVDFSCEPLEEACKTGRAVYLSPDAEDSLDPAQVPPSIVVVGLLIDRRVQTNRSKNRASGLEIASKRWPLEQCFAEINPREPLNVDCVLEGMQQWWWNVGRGQQELMSKDHFIQAAEQAIEHHTKRHPSRPIHLPK